MGALDIINGGGGARVADSALPASIARDSELTTPGNGTLTVSGGNALTGSGTFTANQGSNTTITLNHQDTSSQGSVNNSGNNFIQDITLDAYGHVTGITTAAAGGGVTTITGTGSFVLMRTVRRNHVYSEGGTVAPNGDGNERYGAVQGGSSGTGSGDFQARTDTVQGNPINGGTWRNQSAAGSQNQRVVRLMQRIS